MNAWMNWPYREIWAVDYEFSAPPGHVPRPICLVAHELRSGERISLWEDELQARVSAPYSTSSDALFVAYYASAEMGCHLALRWELPANVLDLFAEFRVATNGLPVPSGNGLLGALSAYGLDTIGAAEKESMRDLAIRGGPWTGTEKRDLIAYCASDVDALLRLVDQMAQVIDLPRALVRGSYMKAAAAIEHRGIPIDQLQYARLQHGWNDIKGSLIERIDARYGVYDQGTFKQSRFAAYLERENIPWPRTFAGQLSLKEEDFAERAIAYPQLGPLRDLRVALGQMRLSDLSVGPDGRNRFLLSAYRSRTGRNQPSNTRCVFGPAVWMRGLIKPEAGHGLAYIDWSQQEFGIAAALSDDPLMRAAYSSGDPYLEFAKQAGAVPDTATKASHKAEREQFKACVLAVQYGMGEESLAARIGCATGRARELLRMHRETYRVFWEWSDAALDHAMLHGSLVATFGWQVHIGPDANPRFLRNFPMQANGAEMLRMACIFGIEDGVGICAPVHDAVLIEAPIAELREAVAAMQSAMECASSIVLDGFVLRSDVNLIVSPERYMDDRGTEMWATVSHLLDQVDGGHELPVELTA